MVKDRLRELQTLAGLHRNGKLLDRPDAMDVFADDADENTRFLRADGWSEVELFLGRVTTTRKNLNEMRDCLLHVKKLHSDILIAPCVHLKCTAELNDNVDKFKQLTHVVSDSIKAMNTEIVTSSDAQESAYARIKLNQVNALSRRLHDLLFQFNSEQFIYRDKCKTKINSYLSIADLQMGEDEVDDAIEKGQLFNTTSILMAERDKKSLFEDVRSRHEDIVSLEKSIRELHDMFQDVAMIVESQSCMVDSIEANVANTVEYTNKALYSVSYAKESKRRNIKLKICLLIVVIIAILSIISFGGAVFCVYFPFLCH